MSGSFGSATHRTWLLPVLILIWPIQTWADGVLDCVHFTDRFDQEVSPPLNTLCISICPESPCGLVSPQCGCKEGFGCYFDVGGRDCLVEGAGQEADACSTANDCDPGLSCLSIGMDQGEVVTRCLRACDSDEICMGGAGSICALTANSGGSNADFCSLACDPLTSSGCLGESACRLFQEPDGSAYTHCQAPVGSGNFGSFCNDESDCQAGHGCFDAGAGNQCLEYCVTNEDCSGPTLCSPFSPAVQIGGVEYGVCL
jgi:hypothetical protein